MPKLRFKNIADTVVSLLSNAATVAREWVFPDKDGIVAMIDDITTAVATAVASLTAYINSAITAVMVFINELKGNSVGWYNVTKFGLVGDGITNNDAAFAALVALAPEGSDFYWPVGTYVFTTQQTINKNISMIGDGGWKTIITTTQNVYVFRYTTGPSLVGIYNIFIEKIRFTNTATTPTAGAAILLEVCGSFTIMNNYFTGFYENVYLYNCFQGSVISNYEGAYVNSAVHIENDGIFIDTGDIAIFNNQFIPAVRNANYSIYQRNAGGTRVIGNKFNWNGAQKAATHYYYDGAGATVDLLINGNSFENYSTSAIRVDRTSGSFKSIEITGNQMAYGPNSGAVIVLGNVSNAAIMSNTIIGGGTSSYAISLTNTTNVRMLNEVSNTNAAQVLRSGTTTNTVDLSLPATTSLDGYLSATDWTAFNAKQAALVSGTNIKTINSTSLLGSGNLSLPGTGDVVGPASAVDESPVIFDTTTGKLVKGRAGWGTWTITFGGFSASPTYVARFIQIGKTVHCWLRCTGQGTSNSTSKTISLPVAAASFGIQVGVVSNVTNGGAGQTTNGQLYTQVSATTADLYRDQSGSTWTNTGNCKFDLSFTYEAN